MPLPQAPGTPPPSPEEEQSILQKIMALIGVGADPAAGVAEDDAFGQMAAESMGESEAGMGLGQKTIEGLRGRFTEGDFTPEEAKDILAGKRASSEIDLARPPETVGDKVGDLARTTTPPATGASGLQARLTEAGSNPAKLQAIQTEATAMLERATGDERKKLNQVLVLVQRRLREVG